MKAMGMSEQPSNQAGLTEADRAALARVLSHPFTSQGAQRAALEETVIEIVRSALEARQ